ncbi:MAG: hypothetical protein U0359_01685 [Byssovorax sp.]
MSQAILSGSAGVAVLSHEGGLFYIDIDRLDDLVPCTSRDIPYLFGEARDQQILEHADPAGVKRALDQAFRGAEALQIALILLDDEMDDETRAMAAMDLEDSLAAPDTLYHVESVLSSTSLPASADLEDARIIAAEMNVSAVGGLLSQVGRWQRAIREVWAAFEAVPARLFGVDDGDRARARAALVREGAFRELVVARDKRQGVGGVVATLLTRPGVKAIRNHVAIMQAWIKPLSVGSVERPKIEAEAWSDERRSGKIRSSGAAPGIDRAKVLEKVTAEADDWGALMRGDGAGAGAADELAEFSAQERSPAVRGEVAARSRYGGPASPRFAFQVELLQRAVGLKGDDAWSWAQLGTALLNVGRHHDALAAYENALAYGSGVIAQTGHAEVLKAMGRLDESWPSMMRFARRTRGMCLRRMVARKFSRRWEGWTSLWSLMMRCLQGAPRGCGCAEWSRGSSQGDGKADEFWLFL